MNAAKTEAVTQSLLNLFKEPGKLPATMSPLYLVTIDGTAPSAKWSISNRILMMLAGTHDARGFRQWKEAGRPVRKGAKAFPILAPLTKKIKDKATGEDRIIVYGFRAIPVFRVDDTQGAEVETTQAQECIDALPLVDVARAWGLEIAIVPGATGAAEGCFSARNHYIHLADVNWNTWGHELMHAADHRAGNLKEKGQHWLSETVAEFGSAVLLTLIGHGEKADIGGAYRYIEHYATAAGIPATRAAMHALDRIDKAITLLIDAASSEVAQVA